MTGDRNWATEIDSATGKRIQVENEEHWFLFVILDGLYRRFIYSTPTNGKLTLIEGEARGADTVARLWAEKSVEIGRKVELMAYPAQWDRHGRAAGPIRNQQMLQEGKPDFCVGVSRDWAKSRGTKDMISRVAKANIPYFKIESPLNTLAIQQSLLD